MKPKFYKLDRRARAVAIQGWNASLRARSLGDLVVKLGTGPWTLDQVLGVWYNGGPGFTGNATPASRIRAFIKNGYFQEVK